MPIDYKNYAPNWKTEIRPAILERAANRCEFCGVHNYAVGYRVDGEFFDSYDDQDFDSRPDSYQDATVCRDILGDHYADLGHKYIIIILTIAHLNHDKGDNDPDNLRALCQRCHLKYDRDRHVANAARTRRSKAESSGQLSLFGGPSD